MTPHEALADAKRRAIESLDAGDRTRAICIMSAALGRARNLSDVEAGAIFGRMVTRSSVQVDIRAWIAGIKLEGDETGKAADTQKKSA